MPNQNQGQGKNSIGAVPNKTVSDATDPLQAPALDASPERFLGQVPAHVAALGEDAPPTPNAVEDAPTATSPNKPPKPGTVRHKLWDQGSWQGPDGVIYPPGSEVDLTPEMAARMRRIATPVGATADVPGSQSSDGGTPGKLTGEATGSTKR